MIEKKEDRIMIKPLRKRTLTEAFSAIDEEMKKRKISFTRAEAIGDDLYE